MNIDEKQIKLRELARIHSDTPYALKTYLRTYDNTQEKMVPLELFPDQIQLLNDYDNYNENISKKYRQAGVSTVTAAWASKKLQLAKPDKPEKILIIANKMDIAVEMANKIRGFLDQWPDWINVGYSSTLNAKRHFKLNNGSEVKAVATSKDALRGFTPTILIFDEAAHIDAEEGFWSQAMSSLSTGGKNIVISCVTKDTFVFTENGLEQVSDFIKSDVEVGDGYYIDDYTIVGKNKSRTSNVMLNNGKQKTLKLHTTNSSLEGTLTHKVWAFSNKDEKYDWYQFKDLSIGDYISVNFGFDKWGNDDKIDFQYTPSPKEHNIFNPSSVITKELSYLLGLYISEGSSDKCVRNGLFVGGNITITCGDDVSKYINDVGLRYSCHDGLHYTISSKNFYSFMEYIGFDLSLKSPQKVIPKRLLSMSKENIKYLLRGIFDGNGFSDSNRGRIGICLSSKLLIEQIRMLLLNFGILTDYHSGITPPTERAKVSSNDFIISTNTKNTRIFYKEIGFNFERKQIKSKVQEKYNINFKDTQDIIPNCTSFLKNILKNNNVIRKTLPDECINVYDQLSRIKNLSRDSFGILINYINENNLSYDKEYVEKIFFENSKWVKINKIEESENETFDFSLNNDINDFWCHSVIYNGILGHQTPRGQDSIYFPIYDGALRGENNYKITDLRWYRDPRYTADLKWVKCEDIVDYMLNRDKYDDDKLCVYDLELDQYDEFIALGYKPYSTWFESMSKKLKYNRRDISQEIESNFLGSGDNVISHKIRENIKTNFLQPPVQKMMDNTIWVWKNPVKGHRYITSCDPSSGESSDSSSITIIDFDEMEQVFEYCGKMPPDLLADLVFEWNKIYNGFTVIDITGGMGIATSRKLLELGYRNMYIEGMEDASEWEYRQALEEKTPGIKFNNKRTQIVASFEEHLRNGFKVRSERLYNELTTFVYRNGRPDHTKGSHDDNIMSMAMGLYVADVSFVKLEKNDSLNKALIESWQVSETTHTVGQLLDSSQYINPINNINIYSTNNSRNVQENYQKYSWLFGKPR